MEAVQEAAKLLGNPTVSARTLGRASLPRAVSGAGSKSGAAGTGSTTCAIPATCEATSRRNPMRPATIMSVALSPTHPSPSSSLLDFRFRLREPEIPTF